MLFLQSVRKDNKVLLPIATLLFCVLLTSQVAFYLSLSHSYSVNTPNTNVSLSNHLKISFHYKNLSSDTYLPEEETIGALFQDSRGDSFPFYDLVLYSLGTEVLSSMNWKTYRYFCLSTYKKSSNTTSSNAIPIGGNAPPR
ncbi:MAG: hypothetical protein K0R21_1708 [Anaerocolumna sp.]|jgi:hypothetical protein|nr:hypothetical protein [Anaerocolumna sp.]